MILYHMHNTTTYTTLPHTHSYARTAMAARQEQQRERERKANYTSAALIKENLWSTVERVVNSTSSLVKGGTGEYYAIS